jgi:hypothetical protein
MRTRTSLMPEKLQQHVMSLRVDDTLRRRLERARQLAASKTGAFVSISAIAKQLLEAARDDRLEVVDLLEHPTDTLLQIRRKGEAGQVISRAEWTTLAHFVRHGVEALPAQTRHAVSRESLVAVLDAFAALYDLRPTADSRLDTYYLGNLPPACRAASAPGDQTPPMSSEVVRRTLTEMRRHLSDPATTWMPVMLGRNLYVLLDEDQLPGAEDLTRALRPYWSVLWRLAARGHYVRNHAPVREPVTSRERLYRPPMPSLTEGAYTVSFAHGEGRELSVLLCFPGVRGPRYPIIGYPRLAEFRTMLADLVTGDSSDWTGTYFSAGVTSPPECREIWFRAHSNGVSFGFTVEEWRTVHTLFRRAWELPDIRVAWDALLREYGEW